MKPIDSLAGSLAGDPDAHRQLLAQVYEDLRQLAATKMRSERVDHTLQPTALVHEAFLRLLGKDAVDFKSRAHFLAIAATTMRRILIDHARSRSTQARGGERTREPLKDDAAIHWDDPGTVMDLDEALVDLAENYPRQAKVVELRFFGGLTHEESAEACEVTVDTVKHDWRFARAWLNARLGGGYPDDE